MARSARVKVLVVTLLGLLTGVLTSTLGPWYLGPQLGFEVAAALYVAWVWLSVHRLDAEGTATHAGREDPGQATTDLVLLIASVASLGAVGLVITSTNNDSGAAAVVQIALALAAVVASWALVHVVFMVRYARLFYAGPDGGVDFNQDEKPTYLDFAYLSFTIGMTFQVSDTEFTTSAMRALALRHALLSYLFGAVILASTINLVAGLGR
jgi:uncharacterized membrane protein